MDRARDVDSPRGRARTRVAVGRTRRARRLPRVPRHLERRAARALRGAIDPLGVAEVEQQRIAERARDVAAVAHRDVRAAREPVRVKCVERFVVGRRVGRPRQRRDDRHAAAERRHLPPPDGRVERDRPARLAGRDARLRQRAPPVTRAVAQAADERREVDRAEPVGERLRGFRALSRILVQRIAQHVAERMRGDRGRQRDVDGAQMLIQHVREARALHHRMSGQAFDDDQAPRVEIAFRGRRLAAQLLRRAVLRRAEHLGRRGER
ncbi:Uncharacterised protein [Burkholderia pseudomallei]|nr:Uncharacterised protein [Burkholderia pseudomallei]